MWEIVAGAAALLIGGAYVLCSALEEENERNARELYRRTHHYENDLRKRREEIERIQSLNNKTEALEQLQQHFLIFKQKSDDAYQIYNSGKQTLITLNAQIKQAFERKNQLKEELKSYKKSSTEFNEKLQQIKEFGTFIQTQIKIRDDQKYRLESFYGILKELNFQTKAINTERKTLQDSSITTMACCGCGTQFHMKAGELLFYKQKGLSFPKRCQKCRVQKRLNS